MNIIVYLSYLVLKYLYYYFQMKNNIIQNIGDEGLFFGSILKFMR